MNPIPSGYIQVPLWVITLILGLLISLMGYIWHRMENRVDGAVKILTAFTDFGKENRAKIEFNTGRLDKLLREGEESMKSEIQKGGFLTLKEHGEMCHEVCSSIAKMLDARFTAFEQKLELQLENMRLHFEAESNRVEQRAIKRGKKKN